MRGGASSPEPSARSKPWTVEAAAGRWHLLGSAGHSSAPHPREEQIANLAAFLKLGLEKAINLVPLKSLYSSKEGTYGCRTQPVKRSHLIHPWWKEESINPLALASEKIKQSFRKP